MIQLIAHILNLVVCLMIERFVCDKCGMCCENLALSEEYADLNDGSGVCKYFDKDTRLCSIYEERPDKCNVEKCYHQFSEQYTYSEYLEKNYEACRLLKGGR